MTAVSLPLSVRQLYLMAVLSSVVQVAGPCNLSLCFDYIALLAQYLLPPRNSVADGRTASTKESSTTTNSPCSLAWMPCAFVTKRSGACAMPRASVWWRCPTGGISRCLPSLPRCIPSTLPFSMRSQLNYEWNVNRSLCSVLVTSYGPFRNVEKPPSSAGPVCCGRVPPIRCICSLLEGIYSVAAVC